MAFFLIMLCISAPAALALSAPSFSVQTGSYTKQQTETITAAAGTIYYTTDGSTPATSSPQYVAPIVVSSPTQINAVAYASGVYSPVATVYLDVDPNLAPVLQNGLILRLRAGLGVSTATGSPPPVSQWADLSGRGNGASGGSGTEPIFSTETMNQLPAVNFNGTSQYLSLPSGFSAFGSGITMFLVTQPSAITSNARLIDLGNGLSGDDILFQISPSGSYAQFWVYNGTTGSSVQSASSLTASQPQLFEAVQSSNTATFYLNGAAGTTNASMQSIPPATRSSNFLGQASANGNYFSGNIAEVLLYNLNLLVSQRVAIEAYLMRKYQILSAVPSTPIISVPGGTLSGPTQVVISAQPGSTTHITTDGTTPTSNSPVYCACPLNISYSQTLKAMSIMNGLQSGIAVSTYVLNPNHWPAPSPTDMTAPTINLQLPAPTQ